MAPKLCFNFNMHDEKNDDVEMKTEKLSELLTVCLTRKHRELYDRLRDEAGVHTARETRKVIEQKLEELSEKYLKIKAS